MNYREYMRRVNHNYGLARQVLAGSISAIEAVWLAATWQTGIGEKISSHIRQESFHDIICGLFTGQLANLGKSGHDTVDMEPDGTIGLQEQKSCDVNRDRIWRNQNGVLYHGAAVPGKKPSGLTSQIRASYSLGDASHRATKKMHTTLMVFDVNSTTNREAPIAAWQLDGEWLAKNRLNKAGKVTVTVGSFIKHGREISANPRAPLMGWKAWCDQLRSDPSVPVHRMLASHVV